MWIKIVKYKVNKAKNEINKRIIFHSMIYDLSFLIMKY